MSDHDTNAPAVQARPASRFVGDRPRGTLVPLDWPVEVDGVTWTVIPCRRITARELDAFYEAGPGKQLQLPTIDAPAAVIAELDADDADRVREVALDFLPRSLRRDVGLDPTKPA